MWLIDLTYLHEKDFFLTLSLNVAYLIFFFFIPCALTDWVMTTGILTWPPTAPAVLMP